MNRKAVIFACLSMTLGGLLFLSEVRRYLNSAQEYKELAAFWKEEVGREQLKKLMIQGRFEDFKQEVALLIPEARGSKPMEGKLRDLAMVIPHQGVQQIRLGSLAVEKLQQGKSQIKKGKYKEGMEVLQDLFEKYPDSPSVVEGQALMVEAYFKQEKHQEAISWVEKMVELYPESSLTGYALLKMAHIYQLEGQSKKAIQVYRTIVSAYRKDHKLVEQARLRVEELEL